MASNQKKRWACPSLAAAPTQPEPTTNRIWVRTRSRSPSGFFSATLWLSTSCSARFNGAVTAGIVGQAPRLPKRKNLADGAAALQLQRMFVDLSVHCPIFLVAKARSETLGVGFCLRRKRCSHQDRA